MSARDTLIYDLTNASNEEPNIFTKRSWLKINDEIQNYAAHSSRINTSSVSASQFLNLQTAYLSVPIMLNLHGNLSPNTASSSCDYALVLKHSFTNLINSLTVSINGNTLINQTSQINLFNNFRLAQNLSFNELQNCTHLGFYPPNLRSFSYQSSASVDGVGTCHNRNAGAFDVVSGAHGSLGTYNDGMVERQHAIVYDADGLTAPSAAAFSSLLTKQSASQLYKSHVFNKIDNATNGIYQLCCIAQIRLKDLHPLFENFVLARGMFMEITLNYNQTAHTISVDANGKLSCTDSNTVSPLGGMTPILFASANTGSGNSATLTASNDYRVSVNVGNKVLDSTIASNPNQINSPLNQQVVLNCEALTMSPNYEMSYLKNPVKTITFEDVYSYKVDNISSSATYDQLIVSGLAGLKSCIIIPTYTSAANSNLSPIFSPFSEELTMGGSPLALLTNLNVRVAGENVLQNTSKYTYEQFIEELHGERTINSGLTKGLSSGLISQATWELSPVYYFNLSRMPANDKFVPKSVSILGQNISAKPIDLYVFLTFERQVKIDILTGMLVE